METPSMNLARFDLVSVRLAVLCAELGSLSAAAWRIPCCLSTASYRLSNLEESFGAQLFTRQREGLRTTGAGDVFVSHAKAILQQVELMTRVVRAAESTPAEVHRLPRLNPARGSGPLRAKPSLRPDHRCCRP